MSDSAQWTIRRPIPSPDVDAMPLRALHLRPGASYLVGPNARTDAVLARYLSSARFYRYKEETRKSYLSDLRLLLNWLSLNGVNWLDCSSEDLEDYKYHRTGDPESERLVGVSKWTRELAAIDDLFAWAVRENFVAQTPVERRRTTSGDPRRPNLGTDSADARDVKWVTPRMWDRWRTIGLEGVGTDGLQDATFRGRSADRNAAYAELLFDSGLRRTEAGTLMTIEIPDGPISPGLFKGQVARATAKWSSGRAFYFTPATKARIESYKQTSRAQAVQRAQAEGRYEADSRRLDVIHIADTSSPTITWRSAATGKEQTAAVKEIGPAIRSRLYRDTPEGPEPLAVWLSESGTPFQSHSWEWVFTQGNARVASLLPGKPPRIHIHMARHSFALYMLVALLHAEDSRFAMTSDERANIASLYPSPWNTVRDLLGHRSSETTRNVYLTPVRDVRLDALLSGGNARFTQLVDVLATRSPLVMDIDA